MKIITAARGEKILVCNSDYVLLKHMRWYVCKTGYAVSAVYLNPKKTNHIALHRFIMGKRPGLLCDHINRNKIDNRRCNLRFVTASQNSCNSSKKPGFSKYYGVSWSRPAKKWKAYCYINYKQIHLGLFLKEEDAAKARDLKAKELHGEFAVLNFPDETL